MARDEYAKQFFINLKIMSRTANGILDTSTSKTKIDSLLLSDGNKAKDIIYSNINKAIDFLCENIHKEFKSVKELEDFILKLARLVNKGIVKENQLFRNAESNNNIKYIKIEDIPEAWEWFLQKLYVYLTCNESSLQPYEIAAFCEYMINLIGHFFSDGCVKTSMLMAMYIFMRYDLSFVQYRSREKHYLVKKEIEITSFERFKSDYFDSNFGKFFEYYQTLVLK